ncbi:hypothetical protein CN884_14035 [Ochrobactrum sp. 30A/1000/2015]|nr:hypothetical protein CN884_14035 [Ochrobactrum sp. 30A/1000/2015]PJT39876.1 hypothetical protein CN883_08585 [Ochrobactrum sp. 27A/999/2015]PJT44169.1 hypothetical protein CN882_09760 [Ochrobactrum sp. 23A/997/2015]
MQDRDLLCRAAVYPSCFSDGAFDEEMAMQLQPLDPARKDLSKGHAMSLASYFLCRDDEGVHRYGASLERLGNERKQKNSDQPLDIEKASHYVGFYSGEYRGFSSIELEHHYIRIYWKPENGLDEHFQFEIIFRGAPGTPKAEIKADVRIARQTLFGLVAGPVTRPTSTNDTDEVIRFREKLINSLKAA